MTKKEFFKFILFCIFVYIVMYALHSLSEISAKQDKILFIMESAQITQLPDEE